MQSSTCVLQVSGSLVKVTASHEEHTSPWRIFSAFLDRRGKNWAHKIIYCKYLSEHLFCQFFPEPRVLHSWSPPWTPLRGCWRSIAAEAPSLILVEVDGKCQLVAAKINYLKTMNTQPPRPTGARGWTKWYCPVTLPPTNQRIINNLITFPVTTRPLPPPNMAFRNATYSKKSAFRKSIREFKYFEH